MDGNEVRRDEVAERSEMRFLVQAAADVTVARSRARAFALASGLKSGEATIVATLVSELARHIARGNGRGEIVVTAVHRGGSPGVVVKMIQAEPALSQGQCPSPGQVTASPTPPRIRSGH